MPTIDPRRTRRRQPRGLVAPAFEGYASLTTRASHAGWGVRLRIAQLLPICAPHSHLHERLGLTFRATVLRDGVPVAEARGREMVLDGLPSVVWRDVDACAAFLQRSREWWPDAAETDAAIAGHVVRELVVERTVEIGRVYVG